MALNIIWLRLDEERIGRVMPSEEQQCYSVQSLIVKSQSCEKQSMSLDHNTQYMY